MTMFSTTFVIGFHNHDYAIATKVKAQKFIESENKSSSAMPISTKVCI